MAKTSTQRTQEQRARQAENEAHNPGLKEARLEKEREERKRQRLAKKMATPRRKTPKKTTAFLSPVERKMALENQKAMLALLNSHHKERTGLAGQRKAAALERTAAALAGERERTAAANERDHALDQLEEESGLVETMFMHSFGLDEDLSDAETCEAGLLVAESVEPEAGLLVAESVEPDVAEPVEKLLTIAKDASYETTGLSKAIVESMPMGSPAQIPSAISNQENIAPSNGPVIEKSKWRSKPPPAGAFVDFAEEPKEEPYVKSGAFANWAGFGTTPKLTTSSPVSMTPKPTTSSPWVVGQGPLTFGMNQVVPPPTASRRRRTEDTQHILQSKNKKKRRHDYDYDGVGSSKRAHY